MSISVLKIKIGKIKRCSRDVVKNYKSVIGLKVRMTEENVQFYRDNLDSIFSVSGEGIRKDDDYYIYKDVLIKRRPKGVIIASRLDSDTDITLTVMFTFKYKGKAVKFEKYLDLLNVEEV